MMDYDGLLNQAKEDGIQKIVVGAVVVTDGKVLCLKRSADDFMPGLWELPSGGMDDDDIPTSLKRELEEESGLKLISIERYIGNFDYTSGSGRKTRQFTFEVKAEGEVVLNPEEHEAYCWADREAISGVGLSDQTRQQVEIALES